METETRRGQGSERVPAWVTLAAILTVEYLAVSFLVDARDLLRPAGLEEPLKNVGSVAPLFFVAVAAVFLTGGSAVRLRLRTLSVYRSDQGAMAKWGGVHLFLFSAAVGVALHLQFSPPALSPARGWLGIWAVAVLGAVFSLLLTLWRASMVLSAVRGLRRELTVGLTVGVAAWAAGMLSRQLWRPAAGLTLETVHALLVVLAPDPVASMGEAIVGTSRFYVVVAPVCSGVEGVGLMLTFVGAFLLGQRRELRWPHAWVLLPIAALIAWLLNVVRVTALIAVGTWLSPSVALGGFHSKAGWVFFTLVALGSVAVLQRSRFLRVEGAVGSGHGAPVIGAHPDSSETATTPLAREGRAPAISEERLQARAEATKAYLLPLLAVLATQLLTGLATSGFDVFYPLSVVAALVALIRFRSHYPSLTFQSPGLPTVVGVAIAAVWIVGFQRSAEPSELAKWLTTVSRPWAIAWLAVRALGSVVTVPLIEELAFRGYLLRRFVSADFHTVPFERFSWLGLLVSSVAFGLLHSQWQLGILAGLAFGGVVVARGRLADAVLAHAVANLVIVVYVVWTGDWSLLG